MRKIEIALIVPFVVAILAGCGGNKVLKEPEPFATDEPLATASDPHLTVSLDWVIIRNGPGTWVKNAGWDEYLLRIRNQSTQPVRLTHLFIVDSLDTRIEPLSGRKQLIKGSKETSRRYKKSGIKIKAGAGRATLRTAGLTAGGAALGAAAAGGGWATAGAIVGGGLVLAPILAVGGVMRGSNNSKVSEAIELRHTEIPLELAANGEIRLDVFFPIAPSPKSLEIKYENGSGDYGLVVEIGGKLDGLHIVAPAE